MRKVHPKYISKIELAKGIPSISYNLNHGGSVVIDRKDPRQSLPAIKKIAEYVEQNKRSVVIFPEGTRSKTGVPKPFAESGLKLLCKYAPSAYMVPLTINNSWKMTPWGSFPLGIGNKLTFTIHPPFAIEGLSFAEIFERTEKAVVGSVRN
jgi:1-acyl-sn-glycerol-3-phosphate acyltransferase